MPRIRAWLSGRRLRAAVGLAALCLGGVLAWPWLLVVLGDAGPVLSSPVIAAALIAGGIALVNTVAVRRTGREQMAANLQVTATTARVEADRLEISNRQLEIQRQEMVAEVTHKLGETYSKAFGDVNAAYDRLKVEAERLGGRLEHLETTVVPDLQTALAACHAREMARIPLDLARDDCLERLRTEIVRLGGCVEC